MQKILFGKKKKHLVIPDGFVLINNQYCFDDLDYDPTKHKPLVASHNVVGSKTIYNADMYVNLLNGRFSPITEEDFINEDGEHIDVSVADFAIIMRDKRAIEHGHIVKTLPEDAIIKFDPEDDYEWTIVKE